MTAEPAADEIARAFVEARQAGGPLPDYPGALPQTLDQAYGIQERAIALFGGHVAGWKVGKIPSPLDEAHGANRLAGPIFADSVVEVGEGDTPDMPIFATGFGAAEAEFLLRLGDLPASFDRAWTNQDVAAHVGAVHVGIEVASSPFPGINDHGPAVTVSDFGNNNGLVIGAAVSREIDFHDWPVALTIDGEVAGTGTAGGMLDGPFGAVRFLFELAARRRLPLAKGQWISTGAVTGVHQVSVGAAVEARFGTGFQVRCRITGKSRI
ncbi:2-keto-4-pentenoate hydratase [Sphingomonas xinjiangensis]|uniref:2-keto-4-pentenoate hydratase n=1 Tax=Sphingomonas xinjiangensis TaxID=643568 RepID=A0A840YNM2_9SPHN|nr:2-keto-4-pentenoate hydratase [Sphingomonas xinjiangensis]MBB5709471.1 2-keto-4-pentenoate hydratase [Sphingomonas xinjiangensis]